MITTAKPKVRTLKNGHKRVTLENWTKGWDSKTGEWEYRDLTIEYVYYEAAKVVILFKPQIIRKMERAQKMLSEVWAEGVLPESSMHLAKAQDELRYSMETFLRNLPEVLSQSKEAKIWELFGSEYGTHEPRWYEWSSLD